MRFLWVIPVKMVWFNLWALKQCACLNWQVLRRKKLSLKNSIIARRQAFGKQTALELTKHGIEVYSYTPGFNHAKSFLVDDQIAYVGTTNLDYRSLLHHYECGTIIYNSNTINDIDDYFEKNYSKSKLLKEEDLKVNPLTKVIISFLRIFESLL